ncbi:MAG: SHOCT domain-containing protein [Chloroflexi bacterium]|nr:SHOCT domain-containing protein [Chloroflexota bacterium]
MKSLRVSLIIGLLSAIIGVGYMLYLMFFGPDRLVFSGKTLSELLQGGELLAVIAIPAALIVTGLIIWKFVRAAFPGEIKNGVNAPAKVLKVWDTGVSMNDNPQVGLLLEVTPKWGASFQAEVKTLVSRLNSGLVQPGLEAEVRYDPQNPKKLQLVSIDTQQLQPSGVAGRLEELTQLRDKGLINADEYHQKREEILKSL